MNGTLPEQIANIQSKLREGQPEVKMVVQVTGQLKGDSPSEAFATARHEILRWLRDEQRVTAIPKDAWDGRAFEIDSTQGRPVNVETLDQFWAMRYENPDANQPRRTWRTEAIIGHTDELALVGIRLTVITQDWGIPFYTTVPRIVKTLVKTPGLVDCSHPLLDRAVHIETEDAVDRLIQLMESPDRPRPIFVLSQLNAGGYSIDANSLAQQTAGIAHVITLTHDSAWQLSEKLGNGLSVYGGSIRTYNPKFDRYSARFHEHPLATVDWISKKYPNSRGFEKFLSLHATSISVSQPNYEDSLPNFSSFRRLASKKRLDEAKKGDKSQGELLKLYEEDNENLRIDLEAASQLIAESVERAEIYKSEKEELGTTVYSLKCRVDALQENLRSTGTEEQIVVPESLREIDEWVSNYFGDRIFLLGRAIKGARKSTYEDTELVYKAIQIIGNEYWLYRMGKCSQDELGEACGALDLEISSTGDRASLMKWKELYEVQWKSRPQFLDMHVKKGKVHDPRYCLRIYFFWDADSEQIVIGHLTSHLKNSFS